MKKEEFVSAVKKLATDAGLRHISCRFRAGDTWVGVYSGIFVVMNLDSVRLHLELTSPEQETGTDSPSQDVQDEGDVPERSKTEDEFDAFRRVEAAGLPGDWFEQNLGEPWGFQLIIDDKRRRVLALEALNGVLDCIAKDLHDLGADESQSCCQCERQATTLGYFETMSEGPHFASREQGVYGTAVPAVPASRR